VSLHQGPGHHEAHGLAESFSVTLHFGDGNGGLAVTKLHKQVARNAYCLVRGSAKTSALRIAEDLSAESDMLSLAALTHMVRGQSEIQSVFQFHRRVAPYRAKALYALQKLGPRDLRRNA